MHTAPKMKKNWRGTHHYTKRVSKNFKERGIIMYKIIIHNNMVLSHQQQSLTQTLYFCYK